MSSITKPVLAILSNENPEESTLWITACRNSKTPVEYEVINLTENNWLEKIIARKYDLLLARPGGVTAHFKQLYDERIYILSEVLKYRIYPTPQEIYIYENKRLLSYWLKANKIPCPATEVFYDRQEAQKYIMNCQYPFVAKTNIGASGSGVSVIRNKEDGIRYVKRTFSGRGSPQRTGPNLEKGGIIKRGLYFLIHPSRIVKKLELYKSKEANLQKNFVIFQEFIHHEFEWRTVRIGNSFFAHKKVVKNGKASGTLMKIYDPPPLKLLDFVKELTDSHGFYSQAIDIFESGRGYLVNEMQCFFGQSDPYQMLVDGRPGRFVFSDGEWIFEQGDFATNMCYDLRLETALKITQSNHNSNKEQSLKP
ncbi:MAG: hypothetical protein JXN62_10845 [Bacteroidales bacterium]|nr:hypothetical protein [Bacteroidales bacterium]